MDFLRGFGKYYRENPWKPDRHYLVVDVEEDLDAFNPDTGKKTPLWIPFCIAEFFPRHKSGESGFGHGREVYWSNAGVEDVYPVVEIIDKGVIDLPYAKDRNPDSKDAERRVRLAQRAYASKDNYYLHFVEYAKEHPEYQPLVNRIWQICHEKSEQDIQSLYEPKYIGDERGWLHPYDQDYDHN